MVYYNLARYIFGHWCDPTCLWFDSDGAFLIWLNLNLKRNQWMRGAVWYEWFFGIRCIWWVVYEGTASCLQPHPYNGAMPYSLPSMGQWWSLLCFHSGFTPFIISHCLTGRQPPPQPALANKATKQNFWGNRTACNSYFKSSVQNVNNFLLKRSCKKHCGLDKN